MQTVAVWPIFLVASSYESFADAQEPISQGTVESPADAIPDEPRADAFSLERAARYLSGSPWDWKNTRACTACHAMQPYLMARPTVNGRVAVAWRRQHLISNAESGYAVLTLQACGTVPFPREAKVDGNK